MQSYLIKFFFIFIFVIVQLYISKDNKDILLLNKKYLYTRKDLRNFRFLEESSGYSWLDCLKQIQEKRFI